MLIGYKIKKIRELKNLTQDYMAERLDMSQSNYSRIEKNEIDLPYTRLQQIADILEVRLTDLIDFDAKYFFNNVNAQTINGNIQNDISQKERELYEEQIKQLKDEVAYLKSLISTLKK